jgi:GNAT superfamily N-acetyltransferase
VFGGDGLQVRPATHGDAAPLANVLARAFDDDPVAQYLFPDPVWRRALLPRFFRLQLCHNYLPRGEVLTTDALQGVALWMPPHAAAPGFLDRLAHMAFLPALRARIGATRRLTLALESRRPQADHYYLGTIGTDPNHRHHGVGGALITPVLERCDAAGLPAYLECSRFETTAFYARFGFVVSDVLDLPGAGLAPPRLYLMWRPAQTR